MQDILKVYKVQRRRGFCRPLLTSSDICKEENNSLINLRGEGGGAKRGGGGGDSPNRLVSPDKAASCYKI